MPDQQISVFSGPSVSELASKQKNLGAERKFLRKPKKRFDATKSSLQNASETTAVESLGTEAVAAQRAGIASSKAHNRAEIPGTKENLGKFYDLARGHEPTYGQDQDADRKMFLDAVDTLMADPVNVDVNGTLKPGVQAALKSKVMERHGRGGAGAVSEIQNPQDTLQDDLTTGAAGAAKSMAEIPGGLASEAVSGPFREGLGPEHPVTKFTEQVGGIAPYMTPLGAPLMAGQAAQALAEGGPEQAIKSFVPVDQVRVMLDPKENPGTRAGAAANLILLAVGGLHGLRKGADVLGNLGDHVRKVSEKFGPEAGKAVETALSDPAFDREAFTKRLQSQETPIQTEPFINVGKVNRDYHKQIAGGLQPEEGVTFHGSRAPIEDVSNPYNFPQSQNLVGSGFYTTDTPGVAGSYVKDKGKLYRVKWTGDNPPKTLDGDAPMPPEVKAVFDRIAQEHDVKTDGSLLDAYKSLRESLAHDGFVPMSEVDEIFTDLNGSLARLGYDAIDHKGGQIVGKTPHNVRIYIEPKDELSGKARISVEEVKPPVTPETPPVVPEAPQTVVQTPETTIQKEPWQMTWEDYIDHTNTPEGAKEFNYHSYGEDKPYSGADVPRHDFHAPDLETGSRKRNERVIREHYAKNPGDDVYQALIPIEDVPSPKFEGELDSDYHHNAHNSVYPAVVLKSDKSGNLTILDGNHRIAAWEEQGRTHVPAWIVDEGGHRSEVVKALAEGKPVPPEVLADYPDLVKASTTAEAPTVPDPVKSVNEGVPRNVQEQLQGGDPPRLDSGANPEGNRVRETVTEGTGDSNVSGGRVENEPGRQDATVQRPESEGISHADTAKERAAQGLAPYVKTKYNVSQYSQEAIDRGHRDNALTIADEVNAGKKTSADRFEQEGLRLAKHDANVARSQAQQDIGAAVDSGDAAAMLDARMRETNATAAHDKLSKALDKVGSEAGGTLGARAYDLVSEGDALSLRKKIQSETGSKVSDADQAKLDAHAKIVTELEKRVADLEAKTVELTAKKTVARGAPRSISRAGRVTNEQFKEAVKTLTTVVKPGQLGSGLGGFEVNWTAAHQEALRVVVRKIVQEGADTLEKVHAKVKETFGKEIDKDKVNQALVDELGRPRDVPVEVLKERAKLNAERRKTRQTVQQIIHDAKWAQKTNTQKGLTHVADALSVPRRLMTFLDDSAIGRQGLFLGMTHPQAAGRAFKGHFEALKKEGFHKVMGRLEADPDYDLFKGTGGYFSDPHSGLHEEGFLNSTLDKIPGLNKLMSKSEDLMSAYLNELRLESFKALKGGLEMGGHKATVKELRWAADMVNVASGRGLQSYGGTLDKAAAQIFFSPQMLISRLQMATGTPIAKGFAASPRAGGLATAEYAKYVLARGVLDTLLTGSAVAAVQAKQGTEEKRRFRGLGGKSSFDVHDKEFGQVRFGKLKADMSGGQDAALRLVGRQVARVSEALKGEKAKYGEGVLEDTATYARNRVSPIVGYGEGLTKGKDFKGDEFKPGWEAVGLVTPIHASSTVEAAHNEKAGWDAAKMLALEVFGFSASYYDKKEDKQKDSLPSLEKTKSGPMSAKPRFLKKPTTKGTRSE